MARTTDDLSGNVDDAEARRRAFIARIHEGDGDSGDSVLDQASPSSGLTGGGSVLDGALPQSGGSRPSVLERAEMGGMGRLREEAARMAAEADTANPNLRRRGDVSGESNGPAVSNGGPGQYVPNVVRSAGAVNVSPEQRAALLNNYFKPQQHSEAGDTVPYAIPGGLVEGAVGRVIGSVGRGIGDLAGAIGSKLGRGAGDAVGNAVRIGERGASEVGTTTESALGRAINARRTTTAAENALGGGPVARRIGQGVEDAFENASLARQRTIPFTTGSVTAGGAAKAAAAAGAGVGAGLFATGLGSTPEAHGTDQDGQQVGGSEEQQVGPGASQGTQSTQPTPPPGFHWENGRLVQNTGTTTVIPATTGTGARTTVPPPGGSTGTTTGGTTGGGAGGALPGGTPGGAAGGGKGGTASGGKGGDVPGTVVGHTGEGFPIVIGADGKPHIQYPPGWKPGGAGAGGAGGTGQGGSGIGGAGGAGGGAGGAFPGGPNGGGPLNSEGQQRQLQSDLNDVANIVRNGPQDRNVQAIFFAQGSKLLDLINQQEQRARAQAESEGRTIDPATQNTLDTLREQLSQQLKATKEALNSRGLLDSGILIEAEQILRKGNMSDQAKILSERLSRIQNNLNSQVSQFGQQRVSTAQTFGLAGANAQVNADESEIDRIEKLRQQMISGRLGLSGQLADQENAVAQRDFTAQQNELERQAAFARANAELAARSNDAEAQRQWQARENDLNRQAQAARDAANQQAQGQRSNSTQAEIDLATNNVIAQLQGLSYDDALAAIKASQGAAGFEKVDWYKVIQSLQKPGFKFPWEQ